MSHQNQDEGQIEHCEDGRRGFTLIELLVVIAVILVLCSLSCAAIAAAIQKTKSAQCQSNLRQYGIALQMYLADFQKYPIAGMGDLAGNKITYWFDVLEPYTFSRWAADIERGVGNRLYHCPAYRGITWPGAWHPGSVSFAGGSYGSNAFGTGAFGSELGMGGIPPFVIAGKSSKSEPLAESKVLAPSNLIFVGDAREGKPFDDATGLWLQGNFFLGTGKFMADARFQEQTQGRHRGRHNILLCDSHVESIRRERLLGATPEARRRFNVDNEPHPETWND